MINSRAHSPWPHEIEAIIAKVAPAEAPALHVSELGHKIRAAIARVDEAERSTPGVDAVDAVVSPRWDDLRLLEKQIPNPPMTFSDLVIRAELAYFGADKDPDDRTMSALENGDCFGRPAARLVEAVLQFAGRDIAKALAPPSGIGGPAVLTSLSPDHLRYREVVAEIARFDEDGYPPENEDDSEAALKALSDEAMAIERKVWATPARTLTDVLFRGEMALYNENGVMDFLDEPEAYYDERSVAQLIKAVVDVLGGRHAR